MENLLVSSITLPNKVVHHIYKYYLIEIIFMNFKNWSENIINKTKILHPRNDNDIKAIIYSAKRLKKHVRVAGSMHSMSPVIVDSYENNIMIISLDSYHRESDIIIDHKNMIVTVNAGFKLAALYDELNKHNYLLETQPASSAFSIGGIVSMPVHGCRLGSGIIADYVVAMTLIDGACRDIYKSEMSPDFDLYRANYGILGIVTSVSFKIIKVNNIHAITSVFYNIFNDDLKINKDFLNLYFTRIIEKCLKPDLISYCHCFVDFHGGCLLAVNWIDDVVEYNVKEKYPDESEVYKLQVPELFLEKFHKNFRSDSTILYSAGKIARDAIMYNIEKNMRQDRDMFWVDLASRVHFMSYFIPVHDGNLKLDNLYRALEVVMETVKKFQNQNFNIDLPLDIRFVTSSDKSKLSPIYNKEKKIVYAALDLVCTGYSLETDEKRITKHNDEINTLYRKFFSIVEEQWIALGGVPHSAKVFGFSNEQLDTFNNKSIQTLLSNEIKDELRGKYQNIFMNKFITTILQQ